MYGQCLIDITHTKFIKRSLVEKDWNEDWGLECWIILEKDLCKPVIRK